MLRIPNTRYSGRSFLHQPRRDDFGVIRCRSPRRLTPSRTDATVQSFSDISSTVMTDISSSAPATTPAKAQRVLVLQGGGALGSYQAGAYQALCHHDFEPEWVAGISIGAINAAIIAGNRAGKARRPAQGILGDGVVAGALESGSSRATAGARFSTRPAPPWSRPSACPASSRRGFRRRRCGRRAARSRRAITTPRRCARRWSVWSISTASTICKTRLSVGAVSVTTGNFRYFDNVEFKKLGKKIGPEHIMASGALPPGFPSIDIEGEHYWDGGIASNTPLDYVLDEETNRRPADLPGRSVQRPRAAAGYRCSRRPSAKRTFAIPAAPA